MVSGLIPVVQNRAGTSGTRKFPDITQTLADVTPTLKTRLSGLYARESPRGQLHQLVAEVFPNGALGQDVSLHLDQVAQATICGLATLVCVLPPGAPCTPAYVLASLPSTVPLVRDFFTIILHDLEGELRVPDLLHILESTRGSTASDLQGPRAGDAIDPLDLAVYFYEGYLRAYNAQQRSQRGVFYTPDPIVSFIVESVDALLRRDCGCPQGLLESTLPAYPPPSGGTRGDAPNHLEPRVNVLDPATGTGPFLRHVLRVTKQSFDAAHAGVSPAALQETWRDYVTQQVLPRLAGCEVLLPPFVVAHLLLGLDLARVTGTSQNSSPAGIILANALDAAFSPAPHQEAPRTAQQKLDSCFPSRPLEGYIPHAREQALQNISHVKRFPVVIGNPPYSRKSQNAGSEMQTLLASYKHLVREEQNLQALSDDYLKFLRLAQLCVERAGWGIVGLVLNNRFLSGAVHRGVRASLSAQFDAIYILNMHGGKKGYEHIPPGFADENVFPIAQGVCVCLCVKRPPQVKGPSKETEGPHQCLIAYCDCFGTKADKLAFLSAHTVSSAPWTILARLEPGAPFFPDPVPPALRAEWATYAPLDALFEFFNVGGKPGDDSLLVTFSRAEVLPQLQSFLQALPGTASTPGAKPTEAQRKIRAQQDHLSLDEARAEPYLYRPFDTRWVYYDPAIWTRGVPALKAQCRGGLLLLCSKIVTDAPWSHAFAATTFPDVIALSNSSSTNCYVFPARVFSEDTATASWNLTAPFQEYLRGMRVNLMVAGDAAVLGYVYALLFAPSYRLRYDALLRDGHFPRVPLTPDQPLFARLATLGQQLLVLHADPASWPDPAGFEVTVHEGDRIASGFPRFEHDRIFLCPDKSIAPVYPAEWQFQVGKYRVCPQWLVARAKRPLSAADIRQFLQIIAAVRATIVNIASIDEIIHAGGGFPLASTSLPTSPPAS